MTVNVSGFINMPTAMWLESHGEPVTSSEDIAIETTHTDTVTVATLTFNPLRISHGGVYRCVGNLESPALESRIEVIRDESLVVQGK